MNFSGALTLLTFLRLLSLSQPSHVQTAKQHIRTEVRSALDEQATTSAETTHHLYNRQHPHGADVHYYNGQRVQRLPHHRRWSGRQRSIDHYQHHHHHHRRHNPNHHHHHHHHRSAHNQFGAWSTWSPCGGEDCVKRRERYCRQKRKCGHTKHVEEQKCWSCQHASTSVIVPHEVTPSSSNTSPAIIINAAAAAASGPQAVHDVIAATTTTTTTTAAPTIAPPKLVHHVPEYEPPVEIVHPPYLPPFSHAQSHEDDDYGESDIFVLKTRRKPSRQRKPKLFEPNVSLEDDDFVDYKPRSFTQLRNQNHRHRDAAHQLNLAGSFEESGVEGDVFQYEDFDFEPELNLDSYEQPDYDDARNMSNLWQQVAKERATPDALVPRHRRLYSKWSRWTKCSPKCTTRRYKKCRVREQCGREVLREIAYCYTEGSFCQQWLQAQVQKTPPIELRPVTATRRMHDDGAAITNNAIVNDYIMNGKGYRGPEYSPQKFKCGIAPIRSNKRNMYNMLKIIGGKASRKGEWPWQVAIFNRFKEAFCGGTLIAPQWVLTAAHCVRKVLYVRIGEHNLDYEDGTEVQLRVLKSFKHPNFDKKTVDSDVALLRLPKPVNATTWIGFSCLPRPYQPLPKNVDCTVIGWGKRRNRDIAGTSVLHQAEVPIIPMDNCRSVYQDYTITKNMFCAGHKRGRIDTCAGDSGGPLLCRDTTKPNHPWTIFGITSFGDGCAKRNKFGIYAKVPNYVDWAWSVINCNGNCKLHQRNYVGEQ